MNKYIGAHVEPYKPVDLTSTSSTPKKRKAKAEKGEGGAKKKAGTQAPYRLSDALVAVVGKRILPRPQVTQALWAYIRENDLQVCCDGFAQGGDFCCYIDAGGSNIFFLFHPSRIQRTSAKSYAMIL